MELELHQLSVYDVARLGETFDLVLFMGVLYHLRHPLLALDLIHEHVARDLLVFQSMQRGSDQVVPVAPDYPFSETDIFNQPGFPRLHFLEQAYASDPTNWWVPNRACSEALLRSAGFDDHQSSRGRSVCVPPSGTAGRVTRRLSGPTASQPTGGAL